MNKILLLILVMLPLAFASDNYFKEGQDISLSYTCYNDYVLCENATCQLNKLTNPKGVILVQNQNMTEVGDALFQYNLTAQLPYGIYNYDVSCTDGVLSGGVSSSFTVNKRGDDLDIGMLTLSTLFYCLFMMAFFIAMFFFVRNDYMKWACLFFTALEFVIMLGLFYVLQFGGDIDPLVRINFFLIGILMIGVFIWKVVELIIDLIDMTKAKKAQKEGFENQDF